MLASLAVLILLTVPNIVTKFYKILGQRKGWRLGAQYLLYDSLNIVPNFHDTSMSLYLDGSVYLSGDTTVLDTDVEHVDVEKRERTAA